MTDIITLNMLRDVVKRNTEDDHLQTIIELTSTPAVGQAENYCSNLYRTKVKIRLTSGKIFEKSLILKVFLKQLEQTAYQEMKQFFSNEVTMYESILIYLSEIAINYNLKSASVWPNCYFASTDHLLMDDLHEEGFVVPKRHAGLSLEEGILVMRYLAKLHALSCVADKRKLIDTSLIRKIYTWARTDNWTSRYIEKGVRTVGQLIKHWGPEWIDIGAKLDTYADSINCKLNELFLQKPELAVVNHGDCWINNILIKYNQPGLSSSADSIKFVDFQNATYNSYAWDLVYFLYTSLKEDILRRNYDKLLIEYRNEFQETLTSLDEKTTASPTVDQIKSEIVRLHPFCVAISCTVMGVVFNTSDQEIQIDDLTNDDEKLTALYSNDNYKNNIMSHLKYFMKNKVL